MNVEEVSFHIVLFTEAGNRTGVTDIVVVSVRTATFNIGNDVMDITAGTLKEKVTNITEIDVFNNYAANVIGDEGSIKETKEENFVEVTSVRIDDMEHLV